MKSYDPALRLAMTEIEEVLKKYDCGAFVSLHSKGHGEFKLCLESPSWSGIRFENDGQMVRVKLHMKSAPENTEASIGMIANIRDVCGLVFAQMDKVFTRLQKDAEIEHTPFGPMGIRNDDRS